MNAEHNLKSLLDAKLLCHDRRLREDLATLDHVATVQYSYPSLSNRFKLCVYRYAPLVLLKIAKSLYAFIQTRFRRTA
jgi:hypothetical protein